MSQILSVKGNAYRKHTVWHHIYSTNTGSGIQITGIKRCYAPKEKIDQIHWRFRNRQLTSIMHRFVTMMNWENNVVDKVRYWKFNYLLHNQFHIALGYGLDDRGFEFWQGVGIYLFNTASRPALGPTQPPIQWVPGVLFLGVSRPGCEADHSLPFKCRDQ
jgi:hypothetical protein